MSSRYPPPQPPQSAAYIQPLNPTSSNPSEAAQSQQLQTDSPSLSNPSTTEPITRTAGDIDSSRDGGGTGSEAGGGLPTALARGVRGSGADQERSRGGEGREEVCSIFVFYFCFLLFCNPPSNLRGKFLPPDETNNASLLQFFSLPTLSTKLTFNSPPNSPIHLHPRTLTLTTKKCVF